MRAFTRGTGSEQYINEVTMNATSTLIKPQQALLEVLLQPDATGLAVFPAYFNVEVTKFMLNRKLIALESYIAADMVFSPTFKAQGGVATITALQANHLFLTLLREPGNGVKGGDFYKQLPVSYLRRQLHIGPNARTTPDLFRCEPVEISWSDSTITGPANFNIGANPLTVPFLATFLLEEQDPTPYRLVKLK